MKVGRASAFVLHRGGCHCGAVAFEVQAPAKIEAFECNCSVCRMTGFLHLIVPASQIRITSGEADLAEYRFGTRTARHLFCKYCGIKPFYVPRWQPDGQRMTDYSVNVRCLDHSTIEAVDIEMFEDTDRGASEKRSHGLTVDCS
jgi:hypothetical protein